MIDVNKCNNHKENGKCTIPHYYGYVKFVSCNCNDVNDCYFKQLQQLKQKNEKLETQKQKAVNLINDIWNITVHLDYTMNKEVANNEIKYIHEITNKYIEQEELTND